MNEHELYERERQKFQWAHLKIRKKTLKLTKLINLQEAHSKWMLGIEVIYR